MPIPVPHLVAGEPGISAAGIRSEVPISEVAISEVAISEVVISACPEDANLIDSFMSWLNHHMNKFCVFRVISVQFCVSAE